nr:MAG TPA: hypothetical protein [Caudoviricetes sp.]
MNELTSGRVDWLIVPTTCLLVNLFTCQLINLYHTTKLAIYVLFCKWYFCLTCLCW